MQVVRELLHTGRCRFQGEHYQIDLGDPGLADLAACPPLLVGSAGGSRTLREITRWVDRIEGEAERACHAWRLARPRDVRRGLGSPRAGRRGARATRARGRPDRLVPVGRRSAPSHAAALRAPFGGGFLSRFLGEPGSVAQALCDFEGLGFDRVQLTEIAPGTLERLRPLLPLRAVQV